jgi:hypothetical protein
VRARGFAPSRRVDESGRANRKPRQQWNAARRIVCAQRTHTVVEQPQPQIADDVVDSLIVGIFILGLANDFAQRRLKPPHEFSPRAFIACEHGM